MKCQPAQIYFEGEIFHGAFCPECKMKLWPAKAMKSHIAHHKEKAMAFGLLVRPVQRAIGKMRFNRIEE